MLLADQYLLLFIQNSSPFRIGFDPHLILHNHQTLTEFGSSLPLSREMTHFYGYFDRQNGYQNA